MNCDTCLYAGLESRPDNPLPYDVCRRNAPGVKGWPIINIKTGWCGQYKTKTPPEPIKCGNCRHVAKDLRGHGNGSECREEPRPVWTAEHGIVVFPPVHAPSDWCGRWEAKL